MPVPTQRVDPVRSFSRRRFIGAAAASSLAAPAIIARAATPATFGLTPVFLDSDLELLTVLETYLSESVGREVSLVKGHDFIIDRRHEPRSVSRHMSVTGG